MRFLLLALTFSAVVADLYMQNPRGNNDRLSEANTNRNNGNRLFDSQNNGKGGYCWGPSMSFYEGSILSIEWTNQHACGANPNLFCNMVVQFMCTANDIDGNFLVRDGDGSTTNTIGDNAQDPVAKNNDQYIYGLNEPRAMWTACNTRRRNMGLYIADRNLQQSAAATRQNNNGNRNGYECAEERDYYPYWHPAPWMDIAILTHNTEYCTFYKKNSQNVRDTNFCAEKDTDLAVFPYGNAKENNQVDCSAAKKQWLTFPSWKLPPPDCVRAPWSRDNHLGNGQDGFANSYNWTLPTQSMANDNNPLSCIKDDKCNCVLRLRYNISTSDVGNTDAGNPSANFIDWTSNGGAAPVTNNQISSQDGLAHRLALNTNQYGRTFQDRSFVFHIKPRNLATATARIHNLNVRGKRGNIVETYPATEYDFVPQYLKIRVSDYVHFQWTGCDNNPQGNAGEGTAGTDRSNIVQLNGMQTNIPASDDWLSKGTNAMFPTQSLRTHMSYLDQTNCLSLTDLQTKHGANNDNDINQDPQNCMKMNAASQYFDGGLVQMNNTGQYHYMSTRNNNFTNRSQKASLDVFTLLPIWAIVLVSVGAAGFIGSAAVAGMMLYSKTHPHTAIANILNKI